MKEEEDELITNNSLIQSEGVLVDADNEGDNTPVMNHGVETDESFTSPEVSRIMKQNKSHIKLLTSKLLFQILQEYLHTRKKTAFSSIHETSNHMSS